MFRLCCLQALSRSTKDKIVLSKDKIVFLFVVFRMCRARSRYYCIIFWHAFHWPLAFPMTWPAKSYFNREAERSNQTRAFVRFLIVSCHVTQSEKMQRLPSILLCRCFFPWFKILTLISITLCIDFVSFLKGQILREFETIEPS